MATNKRGLDALMAGLSREEKQLNTALNKANENEKKASEKEQETIKTTKRKEAVKTDEQKESLPKLNIQKQVTKKAKKNHRMSFAVDDVVNNQINELAFRKDTSASRLIENAVKAYIEDYNSGTEWLIEQLRHVAYREGISLNEAKRQAYKEYLDKYNAN